MSLSVGIVGLPNVGKSTLFNALTKKSVLAANYPFATIDPSVGVVAVPEERLALLGKLSQSEKIIPAAVEFVDIAGLVRGASEGEGLGNTFLSHIREVDAIAEVVRIFEDANVTHVHDTINPYDDIEVVNLELILADQQTVSKRRNALLRDVKRGDKEAVTEDAVLVKLQATLEAGKLISGEKMTDEEILVARQLNLLTVKPFLYVLNKKAGVVNLDETNDKRFLKLIHFFKESKSEYVIVDAGIEDELKDFEGEERLAFRNELGAPDDDGINQLIKAGYRALDLIPYFTTGPTETRAWTVRRNATAPEAGAAIHGDFKEKFIRAEVVAYDDLVSAGSYAKARELGKVRTEGKEYVVKDGDVIEFKI
ncbi:MAG: redox-regulated ATPase YchF [Candidatus Paceibacterota bacterium]